MDFEHATAVALLVARRLLLADREHEIAVSHVREFEAELLRYFQEEQSDLRDQLATGKYSDELRDAVDAAITSFRDRYLAEVPEAKAA